METLPLDPSASLVQSTLPIQTAQPVAQPSQPLQPSQPSQPLQPSQSAAIGGSASNTMQAMQTAGVAAAQRRAELEQAVQCVAERENEA